MELTQEQFDKLQEENENYKKALQEERARRKQAKEELEEYQQSTGSELEELKKFKTELEEKEAKKKGKYEELLSEKEKALAELTEKVASIETKASKYDEFLQKNLEEKLGKIPEEKQEFINKVLGDKAHEEKLELLDWFIQEYANIKPKDFDNKPKDEGGDPDDTSEYQKAKESWDLWWVIANAPRREKQ